MKLSELKNLIEEKDRLYKEIADIRKEEDNKMSETQLEDLKQKENSFSSCIECMKDYYIRDIFKSYSSDTNKILLDKYERINLIIKQIKEIIKSKKFTFAVPLNDFENYIQQYFKDVYNQDIQVRIGEWYRGYEYGTINFDFVIETDDRSFKLAHMKTFDERNLSIDVGPFLIRNYEEVKDSTGFNIVCPYEDYKSFLKTYPDFKEALWYAIKENKSQAIQEALERNESDIERNNKDLENLQSPEYMMKLFNRIKEERNQAIDQAEEKNQEYMQLKQKLKLALDDIK